MNDLQKNDLPNSTPDDSAFCDPLVRMQARLSSYIARRRDDLDAPLDPDDPDGLAHAGVLVSGAGKVRLYHWSELDPGWDPSALSSRAKRRDPQAGTASPAARSDITAWEATHHLIERLNTHGEEGAAMLLAKMPSDLAAESRQLAYRLYSICERKGWAEHARDYNTLAISWSASQEQAREFKEQYQQGTLL